MSRTAGPSLDALDEALAVQQAASRIGFDWPDIQGPLDKVREELDEIHAALDAHDHAHARRELGDLLFSVVNLARFLDADPSEELRAMTGRFTSRFERVKVRIMEQGRRLEDCTLAELDALWDAAKADGRDTSEGDRSGREKGLDIGGAHGAHSPLA